MSRPSQPGFGSRASRAALLLFPLLAVLSLMPVGAEAASPLADVLARMDQAAQGFRGMTANIHKISFTAVIKDTSEETGRMTLLRPKPKDMRMLVEFDKPDPRAVSFQGKKIQIYYPKLAVVQEYDLGKQSSLVDEFLLLGFGTATADLKKSYEIKATGEETLDGVKTDRLELVPRSDEARRHVVRIEIWVSQADGLTLQQKIHQPSKDYVQVSYTGVKRNPPLTENDVRLNLPKGVKKETPQK